MFKKTEMPEKQHSFSKELASVIPKPDRFSEFLSKIQWYAFQMTLLIVFLVTLYKLLRLLL